MLHFIHEIRSRAGNLDARSNRSTSAASPVRCLGLISKIIVGGGLGLFLLSPFSAFAASVAFVSGFDDGFFSTSPATFTVNTSTSTSPAVCINSEGGTSNAEVITSATIGGISAVNEGGALAATDRFASIWCATGVPVGSSESVSVNFTGSFLRLKEATYTNVANVFGGQTTTQGASSPLTMSTTTTIANSMIEVNALCNCGANSTAGTGATLRILGGDPFYIYDNGSAVAAGSVSLSVNDASPTTWAGVLVILAPASSVVVSVPTTSARLFGWW
jgi:hypothetical protein